MANKKCPKCGEDNPADAVMCWACYTPLSGAAPLGVGAAALPATAGAPGRTGGPDVSVIEDEKKGVDPKVIGVGAVLLVGALAAGFFMFSGGGGEDPGTTGVTPGAGGDPIPSGGGGAPAAPPPNFTMPAPSGGGAAVAAVPLPYQMVVPPNPKYSTGTAGILATQPNISSTQAVGLAKSARNQFMASGRWQNMQIVVFSNSTSANAFRTFQASRQGAKLTGPDYQALAGQNVWTGAAAFYETVGNREYSAFPSASPNGWWSRAPR